MRRICLLSLLAGIAWTSAALAAKPDAKAPGQKAARQQSDELTFEKHVRPLLKVHCVHCHGEGDEREGNLDVRLRRLMVSGGDSGPAIDLEHPHNSLVLERLRSGEMPPGDKKLKVDEIATIERWIVQGAKTARPEPEQLTDDALITDEERSFWSFQPIRKPAVPKVRAKKQVRTPVDAFELKKLEEHDLTFSDEADRDTIIRRATFDLLGLPPTPAEVDEFVNDREPKAYERLIDRLLERPEYGERWGRHWLDIAGYADSDGYTPKDPVRPHAYRYRDYVIRSLNEDKPFDEFIREQLAGDELIGFPRKELKPDEMEKLIATGFLRMAQDGTADGEVDQNVARNLVVADTLKIVSTSLLGLTIGCAECHDHKYDPISQADYYRLRAVFEPALDWKSWKTPIHRQISLYTSEQLAQANAVEAEAVKLEKERKMLNDLLVLETFEEVLATLPEKVHAPLRAAFNTDPKKRTPEQIALLKSHPGTYVNTGALYLYDRPRQAAARAAETKLAEAEKKLKDDTSDEAKKELAELKAEAVRLRGLVSTDKLEALTKQITAIRAKKPVQPFAHAISEVPGKVPKTYVFHRGDCRQPKQEGEPGEPTVFASSKSLTKTDKTLATSGRRTALAARLTDPEHPLVGRVLVNRIWLLHFGRGLVATPTDFGVLGQQPSHPELLDWLARDFIDHGWHLKRVHRQIMTSSVYRQSSKQRPELSELDPENVLLARMNVRRAEAEAIRDAILAVSGKLNPKRFGPPVPVTPDEVGQVVLGNDTRDTAGRFTGKNVSLGDEAFRRSVYVQVRRSLPLGMLETFDAPTMSSSCNCEARSTSTVAPQSLMLMNNEFLIEQAGYFAARLEREADGKLDDEIALAWRLAFSRSPSETERTAAVEFIEAQIVNSSVKNKAPHRLRALTNLCQALLSSNEFLYVD